MPDFLISPAEHHTAIKSLGRISSIPERYGADILWWDDVISGWVGVQRKAVPDLVASVTDGRLAKEIGQMNQCKVTSLIVEGRAHWSTDGVLMKSYARWTKAQHRSLLRSIQNRGVFVEHSDSPADTAVLVGEMASWVSKGDHKSLDRRPNPPSDTWGRVSDKAWGCHLLQSIPDIGPKQAEEIWDHFEGKLPLQMTVGKKDLLKVRGLGPKKAEKILKAFGGEE